MASDTESGNEFEVAEILNKRKRGNIVEYLVRWKEFGTQEDSWEPLKNLKHAQKFIDIFTKSSSKKTKTRSKSRTRSTSRSQSRSRSRSSSRGRTKASPTRSSKVSQEKTSPIVSSTVTEEKILVNTNSLSRSPRSLKETIHQWPGRYEKTTETRTESKPSEATTRSTYQKKTETIVTSASKQDRTKLIAKSRWSQTWRKYFHPTSSDYPVLVIFTCIAVIILAFLLEGYVKLVKRFCQTHIIGKRDIVITSLLAVASTVCLRFWLKFFICIYFLNPLIYFHHTWHELYEVRPFIL